MVNLLLVNTARGALVWSGREVFQEIDVASASSAAPPNLAPTLRSVLASVEKRRVKAQPIAALNAPELVLRAYVFGRRRSSLAGTVGARKLVDEALRLEPNLVFALILPAAPLHHEGSVDP